MARHVGPRNNPNRRPRFYFLLEGTSKLPKILDEPKPSKHSEMGAFKRKADPEAAPSKKDKSASSDRSAKRPRKSESTAEHTTPPKAKPESSAQKSIFKDEETAFPRGGASVLTPLEHKQIQIKATQDVLFEQAGGLKRGADDGLSDQGSDTAEEERKKAANKRKSKKSKPAQDNEVKEPKVKAEGLTAKVCGHALFVRCSS